MFNTPIRLTRVPDHLSTAGEPSPTPRTGITRATHRDPELASP